jgi:hypothetical protein
LKSNLQRAAPSNPRGPALNRDCLAAASERFLGRWLRHGLSGGNSQHSARWRGRGVWCQHPLGHGRVGPDFGPLVHALDRVGRNMVQRVMVVGKYDYNLLQFFKLYPHLCGEALV